VSLIRLLTLTGFDWCSDDIERMTGMGFMAAILQFEKHRKLLKAATALAPGQNAKILMFTGVRFERIDFDALKAQHDAMQMTVPARIAN
jgi:hypothetical protein